MWQPGFRRLSAGQRMRRSERVVGKPSLTGLWKGCPSLAARHPVQYRFQDLHQHEFQENVAACALAYAAVLFSETSKPQ
jgi:hypothetical protein